jgi:hypothetical protein
MTEHAVSLDGTKTVISTRRKRVAGKSYALRCLGLLAGTIFVLLCLHLLLQYLNLEVFKEKQGQIFELSNRLDFDDESSIPTWFSQIIFLAIGAGSLLAGYLQTDKPRQRLWRIVGVIAVLVSIDEIIAIHEYALQSLHLLFFSDSAPKAFANAWWLILPFVLAGAGWLLYKLIRLFPPSTVWLLATGGALFLAGAVGVDILAISVPKASFLSQGILVAVEETLEMAGGAIILYAVMNYLEIYHSEKLHKAARELRAN